MQKLLLFQIGILILSGCSHSQLHNQYQKQALPTVVIKDDTARGFPVIFESAFLPHTQVVEDTVKLRFYRQFIGNLSIESGRIIACDAVTFHDKPFTQTFPIGKFPVELAIAQFQEDERVAFARILFSAQPVEKWEMALLKGQRPLPIDGERIYGYSVDAGVGLFMDLQARQVFDQLLTSDSQAWEKIFIDEQHTQYKDTRDWTLYEYEGHTLAAFSTGLGDGVYQTYVGWDERGQICRLLTDFGLVGWVKDKASMPPRPATTGPALPQGCSAVGTVCAGL